MTGEAGKSDLLDSSDRYIVDRPLAGVFPRYEFQHSLGSMAHISRESTTHGPFTLHWTLCTGAEVEICNRDGN